MTERSEFIKSYMPVLRSQGNSLSESKRLAGVCYDAQQNKREAMHSILRQERATNLEVVEEYISEAEHQEGNGYFPDNFGTKQELLDDFDLYVINREEE